MSQPVKLSDALVLDARIAGEAQERSIAGQVEFWAKLGRATELLLDGRKVMTLRMNAGAQPLSEALASVETPEGRRGLRKFWRTDLIPITGSIPVSRVCWCVSMKAERRRWVGL